MAMTGRCWKLHDAISAQSASRFERMAARVVRAERARRRTYARAVASRAAIKSFGGVPAGSSDSAERGEYHQHCEFLFGEPGERALKVPLAHRPRIHRRDAQETGAADDRELLVPWIDAAARRSHQRAADSACQASSPGALSLGSSSLNTRSRAVCNRQIAAMAVGQHEPAQRPGRRAFGRMRGRDQLRDVVPAGLELGHVVVQKREQQHEHDAGDAPGEQLRARGPGIRDHAASFSAGSRVRGCQCAVVHHHAVDRLAVAAEAYVVCNPHAAARGDGRETPPGPTPTAACGAGTSTTSPRQRTRVRRAASSTVASRSAGARPRRRTSRGRCS